MTQKRSRRIRQTRSDLAVGHRVHNRLLIHQPPAEALADRERRQELALNQSPCQALLGDPLPGYRALDKRNV